MLSVAIVVLAGVYWVSLISCLGKSEILLSLHESFSLRITQCLCTDANNFDKSIWIGRGQGGGRRYNCYLLGPYAFSRYRLIQHGPPPKNGCLPYWSNPNRFQSSKWFYFIPHLTYCHLAWNFCKSSDSRKIERVQERALRAIYKSKTETCEELLARARLPTLYNRRLQDIATLMYKVG